jgi:tRNA 2-thiouridine synthesizing protein A
MTTARRIREDAIAVHELDATGLKCPIPVLGAVRALRGLKAGDVLLVKASDPAAPKDFAAFCAASGHRLIMTRAEKEAYVFKIEVGAGNKV